MTVLVPAWIVMVCDGDGVVVTDIDADSEAATRGVQVGDVIVAVNGFCVGGGIGLVGNADVIVAGLTGTEAAA